MCVNAIAVNHGNMSAINDVGLLRTFIYETQSEDQFAASDWKKIIKTENNCPLTYFNTPKWLKIWKWWIIIHCRILWYFQALSFNHLQALKCQNPTLCPSFFESIILVHSAYRPKYFDKKSCTVVPCHLNCSLSAVLFLAHIITIW